MLLMFIFICLMISLIFMFLNHPLSLGLGLLIQTILIALMTGFMSMNYWFSYIIFLIMIGGMLILFIYMTSVASNEKFKFSFKLFLMSSLLTISFLPFIFIDSFYINKLSKNFDLMNQNTNLDFSLSLNKFINWPYNSIFIMMIIYLLITLVMAVKVTNINHGPLRQKI
uniref:NADH-ubiquinone oxidoreductase chain 6 n=1 Tax=Aulaconotus atronotatus TaxID=2844951 RepID=A0A8F0WQH4_9CUCU|nr:NADH dehydrogenase subunit 6 [Aulaconotus atronotatus]